MINLHSEPVHPFVNDKQTRPLDLANVIPALTLILCPSYSHITTHMQN